MCCHRRIIYAICGHSTFSPTPLMECRNASIDPTLQWSTVCEIVGHPYKSLRIDSLCPACQARRDTLLREIEESQVVRFDEWQWKVSYGMPSNNEGDEYWNRKAEEREEMHKREEKATRSKSKRFSWRKSKRKSAKAVVVGDEPKTPKTPGMR